MQVTLTRTGSATGDVALSLTGLPDEVSAAFSPAILSGDSLTSTLTLSAPAEASEGFQVLEVTAEGPELTANSSLQVEVVGLTVTGTFASPFTGPLPGVAVASQDDTAVTDSNGRFTLRGLSVPYDITAWSVTDKWLHEYQGLTKSEVALSTLVIPAVMPMTRTTTLSGSLSGDALPVGLREMVLVCLEGISGFLASCKPANPDSPFSLTVTWLGAATLTARLHLLHREWNDASMPVAYHGYASRDIELEDGVPLTLTEAIDMGEPLETTTVALEIESPVRAGSTSAAVQIAQDLAIVVATRNDGADSFDLVMPKIPGATYSFVTYPYPIVAWTAGVTGTAATIVVPELPTLTAPAPGATGVTLETDFTATNPAGGPMTWFWLTGDVTIGLTSMSGTVNIPDGTEYGLPLPKGARLELQLMASGGTAVEDGTAAIDGYMTPTLFSFNRAAPGFKGDGSATMDAILLFTTAP